MKVIYSQSFIPAALLFLAATISGFASEPKTTEPPKAQKSSVQKIIFAEQKIEGKIRRPQMVLIKADQRPVLAPMIMQGTSKNDNVAASVDPSIIDSPLYPNAFKFKGTTIVNYVP